MLLIVCGKSRSEEIARLLETHGIQAYTEVPTVIGSGLSGKHLGTRASPGTQCMLFTLIAREKVPALIQELKNLHGTLYEEEALSCFSLDAERML